MRFPVPLVPARLVRRYKRFLADMLLEDGTLVTAHVANSGAMTGLMAPGARAWLRPAAGPGRKLAYSWEVVEADFGAGPEPVGVNTMHPNGLVAEAIRDGLVPHLSGYGSLRREVRYGVNSRIDLLLEQEGRAPCYVEVKNVHLMRHPGRAEFPDCITARGTKHLVELAAMRAAGARAVMVYLSQIGSAASIALARDIDPAYGRAFDTARAAGVEAIGLVCTVSPEGIRVRGDIPMQG